MALDEEMQAALTRLSEVRLAADEATQSLNETSHTQVSKRKLLSVTVGLSGQLQSLAFHGEAYRKLSPVELAAIIVETVSDAREGAQEKAAKVLGDVFPEALGNFDNMTSTSNMDDFMTGLLKVAGDEFSQEEIDAFEKSWRGESL
ncbi:hypothetical protein GCM10022223_43830 [Kineosporia mesophila]|uniref:YbaB/EbfC DNA-binding family protein n=1 Tax=Kineosporia mesophila TaxID=566012 RepID=A0ABP6ZY02_9ACTN|nr:YbaB/EbfC family nucleoid-associated protein [Kineosporia mesophila]MCD5348810.1 YbaB/EbfC family nucleoid-associated protein [Kineosporia mesophila]